MHAKYRHVFDGRFSMIPYFCGSGGCIHGECNTQYRSAAMFHCFWKAMACHACCADNLRTKPAWETRCARVAALNTEGWVPQSPPRPSNEQSSTAETIQHQETRHAENKACQIQAPFPENKARCLKNKAGFLKIRHTVPYSGMPYFPGTFSEGCLVFRETQKPGMPKQCTFWMAGFPWCLVFVAAVH